MHMRMVIKLARVRVQYGHRARFALQVFVTLAEGVHGFPCAPGDEVINGFLVAPRQLAPLLWQSEGEHEIIAGQLPSQLALYPLL